MTKIKDWGREIKMLKHVQRYIAKEGLKFNFYTPFNVRSSRSVYIGMSPFKNLF